MKLSFAAAALVVLLSSLSAAKSTAQRSDAEMDRNGNPLKAPPFPLEATPSDEKNDDPDDPPLPLEAGPSDEKNNGENQATAASDSSSSSSGASPCGDENRDCFRHHHHLRGGGTAKTDEASARWRRLTGHNCWDTCRPYDAVKSGQYKDNRHLHVCAANAGYGYRGGYNLSNGVCTVGYGGREVGLRSSAYCLCNGSKYVWRNAAGQDGNRCTNTCGRYGQSPVLTGYHRGNHGSPFYICSSNYANAGYRGGYNLHDWGCTFGYGGREQSSIWFRCLCHN